ncbi:MAG: GNAT family N-acetyltransferase [Flavisolibacter sp.]
MEYELDNPAWYALVSGNKGLCNGNEVVKYFDKEVSPFAAIQSESNDNFQILYDVIPFNDPLIFITVLQREFPKIWVVRRLLKGLQMVFGKAANDNKVVQNIFPLSQEHVPQMLSLTKLTKPGPFGPRTIEFGHYHGIFENNQLVSMAGQRLLVYDFAEISGVCTHPAYVGRGYARQLLLHHIHRIQSSYETPFLHVRSDNQTAIRMYESLGFFVRKEIFFYVLQKAHP